MSEKTFILGLIGVLTGLGAYEVYTSSGLLEAAAVLTITSWFMIHFLTKMSVIKSLSSLLDPFRSWFTFMLGGFTYAAFQGKNVTGAFYFSIGTAFLGAAFSMLVYKYWTIGD